MKKPVPGSLGFGLIRVLGFGVRGLGLELGAYGFRV